MMQLNQQDIIDISRDIFRFSTLFLETGTGSVDTANNLSSSEIIIVWTYTLIEQCQLEESCGEIILYNCIASYSCGKTPVHSMFISELL